MNIGEYEFHVGDEVITADGIKGVITGICDCEYCRERGYLEPYWEDEDGEEDYITIGMARHGFYDYYQIGKYRFGNLNRELIENDISRAESMLVKLRKQLQVIEELEREGGVTHE